jgi:hypothetical protein
MSDSFDAVKKMINLLQEENESPHYTIGYLESMLGRLAYNDAAIRKEVDITIKYLEERV